MRKLIIGATLAALAVGLAPAKAETSGSIAVPTATVSRTHRCAWGLQGDAANGIAGWTVAVTPGSTFTLTATGDTAAAQDLDISFHATIQPCEANATAATPQHTNGDGDEAGTVPDDATHAIINLAVGANASFVYAEN